MNVDLKYVVLRVGKRNGWPCFPNEYWVGLCAGNNWYKRCAGFPTMALKSLMPTSSPVLVPEKVRSVSCYWWALRNNVLIRPMSACNKWPMVTFFNDLKPRLCCLFVCMQTGHWVGFVVRTVGGIC